jgi:hypothetical protein
VIKPLKEPGGLGPDPEKREAVFEKGHALSTT